MTTRSEPTDAATRRRDPRRARPRAASRRRVGLAAAATDPGRPPDGRPARRHRAGRSATARRRTAGEIRIHDTAALVRACCWAARPGAGEAYMDGLWSSPDLPAPADASAALNREALGAVGRLVARARPGPAARSPIAPRRNTQRAAAAATSPPTTTWQRLLPAVPRRDDDLLERRLRDRRTSRSPTRSATSTGSSPSGAGLAPGMHVLEIGTGWGGFALYAAGELGCRVTSITISRAQHELATRARPRGRARATSSTSSCATIARSTARTTRSSRSRCSRRSAPSTSRRSSRPATAALEPGGRMSLQSITFPDAAYEAQRRGANWIQTVHLPGRACARRWPPSSGPPRGTRLLIRGVRGHRATLRPDAPRLADAVPGRSSTTSARLGFDERFIRMWEYYLALSEAGFATGSARTSRSCFEKGRGIA